MQEYVHVLGDAVKQARLDLRLTQFEVAESIHADERTIANIEHYKPMRGLTLTFRTKYRSPSENRIPYPPQML